MFIVLRRSVSTYGAQTRCQRLEFLDKEVDMDLDDVEATICRECQPAHLFQATFQGGVNVSMSGFTVWLSVIRISD
ncbi:hypothetical protein Bca52824_027096 [Brassica carinata]|uniref:Uncharacterized protein n=1 Tax=Brassica carinata TaxID=52824 RepID=A0A8X7SJ89_BRACI|nr:hypothetical protein Bca52824_027096 [Brassica carinata]